MPCGSASGFVFRRGRRRSTLFIDALAASQVARLRHSRADATAQPLSPPAAEPPRKPAHHAAQGRRAAGRRRPARQRGDQVPHPELVVACRDVHRRRAVAASPRATSRSGGALRRRRTTPPGGGAHGGRRRRVAARQVRRSQPARLPSTRPAPRRLRPRHRRDPGTARLALRRPQRARAGALLLPGLADPAALASPRPRARRRRHQGSHLLDAHRACLQARRLPDPARRHARRHRGRTPSLARLAQARTLPARLPPRALRADHAARLRPVALLRRREAHRTRRPRDRLPPHPLG